MVRFLFVLRAERKKAILLKRRKKYSYCHGEIHNNNNNNNNNNDNNNNNNKDTNDNNDKNKKQKHSKRQKRQRHGQKTLTKDDSSLRSVTSVTTATAATAYYYENVIVAASTVAAAVPSSMDTSTTTTTTTTTALAITRQTQNNNNNNNNNMERVHSQQHDQNLNPATVASFTGSKKSPLYPSSSSISKSNNNNNINTNNNNDTTTTNTTTKNTNHTLIDMSQTPPLILSSKVRLPKIPKMDTKFLSKISLIPINASFGMVTEERDLAMDLSRMIQRERRYIQKDITVVFAIRRPGCGACRNHGLQLTQLAKQTNVALTGIIKHINVDDEALMEFYKHYFHHPLYKDEEWDIFNKALGARKISLWKLLKSVPKMNKIYQQRNITNIPFGGDIFTQGGVLIFDRHGKLRYVHYENYGNDLDLDEMEQVIQDIRTEQEQQKASSKHHDDDDSRRRGSVSTSGGTVYTTTTSTNTNTNNNNNDTNKTNQHPQHQLSDRFWGMSLTNTEKYQQTDYEIF